MLDIVSDFISAAPKQVVCELARERLWMASDIGRHPSDLLLEYPALDFSALAGK